MEKTKERTRSDEVDLDLEVEHSADETTSSGGLRSRVAGGASRAFSLRGFVVALAAVAVGMFAGGSIPLLSSIPVVGGLAGLVGVFAATFVLGAVGASRYREVGVAGGVVAGVSTFTDFLLLSFLGVGLLLVAAGAAFGAGVAVAGLYFGRDLRTGLTQDL